MALEEHREDKTTPVQLETISNGALQRTAQRLDALEAAVAELRANA